MTATRPKFATCPECRRALPLPAALAELPEDAICNDETHCPVLRRCIEEMIAEEEQARREWFLTHDVEYDGAGAVAYNRMHNRHNRSGMGNYRRMHNRHNRSR